MRAPRVVVGYHSFGHVHTRFCHSLVRGIAYEGNRIDRVIELMSPYTEEARNKIVEVFLAATTADYLLMVDADIEFERDSISKTMWVAQNHGADVVWGNYALGTFGNSIFSKDPKSDWALVLNELKPNMIYTDVYAGGTGWCLMTRSVLERMKKEQPGPWHWFGRDLVDGPDGQKSLLGEDIGFGRRVSMLRDDEGKRPLQVGYTGLILIHHKYHATVPDFMKQIVQGYDTYQPLSPVRTTDPVQAPEAAKTDPEITPEATEPEGKTNGTVIRSL